jgi:signal transduction histidine kinase
MQMFELPARQQKVKLKLSFLMRDVLFLIDVTRTKQIIINLVSNAIKFSQPG